MKHGARRNAVVLALLSAVAAGAWADERTEYMERAAARDVQLYQSLDLDADGMLTREESRSDLTLGPRFDDIDIDRDGIVTPQEMERYLRLHYGVDRSVKRSASTSR